MTFEYYKRRGNKAFDDIISLYISDYDPKGGEIAQYNSLLDSNLYGEYCHFTTLLPLILRGYGITKFGNFRDIKTKSLIVQFSDDEACNNMEIIFTTYLRMEKIIRLLYPNKYHIQVKILSTDQITSIRGMMNTKCHNNIIYYWLLNNIVVSHLISDLLLALTELIVFDLE